MNLSVGIAWGLHEQSESQAQGGIGIVGAPMPFVMGLMDNGEDRLFIFIQHRLPGGPYCAEIPAKLEDVSVELTAPEGDPTIPGPEYSKTYVWTPTEAGEYVFCAYLDAAAANQPAMTNFVKLTADPEPGQLSFTVIPEGADAERDTIRVEGTAAVPSELIASVQEQGLACTLPEGRLAGQQLPELPDTTVAGSNLGLVGTGPFASSYTFAVMKPGAYEVCAYLTPAASEKMFFGRPYEVGSTNFSIEAAAATPASQRGGTSIEPNVRRSPALSGVAMSNSRFRVAPGRAHGATHAPIGTVFRFSLSAPATVTVALTRLLSGVLRGRLCAPPPVVAAGAVHARRCNRREVVGSIVRPQTAEGEDVVPFGGVIGHHKLAAGSYSAVLTASNTTGRSGSVSLRFSVAP
jgi:hypothetical protein